MTVSETSKEAVEEGLEKVKKGKTLKEWN